MLLKICSLILRKIWQKSSVKLIIQIAIHQVKNYPTKKTKTKSCNLNKIYFKFLYYTFIQNVGLFCAKFAIKTTVKCLLYGQFMIESKAKVSVKLSTVNAHNSDHDLLWFKLYQDQGHFCEHLRCGQLVTESTMI